MPRGKVYSTKCRNAYLMVPHSRRLNIKCGCLTLILLLTPIAYLICNRYQSKTESLTLNYVTRSNRSIDFYIVIKSLNREFIKCPILQLTFFDNRDGKLKYLIKNLYHKKRVNLSMSHA